MDSELTEYQVLLPLGQGMLWTLALSGWRYWNRSSQLKGASVGAKVRRWWWNVNNWEIPDQKDGARKTAEGLKEVRVLPDSSLWDFL